MTAAPLESFRDFIVLCAPLQRCGDGFLEVHFVPFFHMVGAVLASLWRRGQLARRLPGAACGFRATSDNGQRAQPATATYASCGKPNLPPSSISEVDNAAVLDATEAIVACRSASLASFSKTVMGVARNWNLT